MTAPGRTPLAVAPARLDLRYRLAALPSTQHRAGLAGLVLLVRWLQPLAAGCLDLVELDAGQVHLQVDRIGLDALLAELYRTQPKPGSPGPVGPGRVPCSGFQAAMEPAGSGPGAWTRLWQDWLWSIQRPERLSRAPFLARLQGRDPVAKPWRSLTRDAGLSVEREPGGVPAGVEQQLDQVPVREWAGEQFLLGFWPVASLVYQLRRSRFWGGRPELDGFVAVVPDVADLAGFCAALPAVLRGRSADRDAGRPREALVDHPLEAILDAARRFRMAAPDSAPILAFEADHRRLRGRLVSTQAVARLQPGADLIQAYSGFRSLGYLDPGFRQAGIRSLVGAVPWLASLAPVFAGPGCLRTTFRSLSFRRDARLALRVAARSGGDGLGRRPGPEPGLAALVRTTVEAYLDGQGADRERLALDAFLVLQARAGAAFAAAFAARFAQVTRLPVSDRRRLAHTLNSAPDPVRILTLLALCAF